MLLLLLLNVGYTDQLWVALIGRVSASGSRRVGGRRASAQGLLDVLV